MKKRNVKTVVGLVIGYCTSAATQQALQNLVPVETGPQKAILMIGSFGVGLVATGAVRTQTDEIIDDIYLAIQQINDAR